MRMTSASSGPTTQVSPSCGPSSSELVLVEDDVEVDEDVEAVDEEEDLFRPALISKWCAPSGHACGAAK